jgi:hypothetical protein
MRGVLSVSGQTSQFGGGHHWIDFDIVTSTVLKYRVPRDAPAGRRLGVDDIVNVSVWIKDISNVRGAGATAAARLEELGITMGWVEGALDAGLLGHPVCDITRPVQHLVLSGLVLASD